MSSILEVGTIPLASPPASEIDSFKDWNSGMSEDHFWCLLTDCFWNLQMKTQSTSYFCIKSILILPLSWPFSYNFMDIFVIFLAIMLKWFAAVLFQDVFLQLHSLIYSSDIF